jgi:hypothetical protein
MPGRAKDAWYFILLHIQLTIWRDIFIGKVKEISYLLDVVASLI